MSFYRNTTRTARKEHKCELCDGTILRGEKYHDKAGNQDGDLWTSKECEKCQPVIVEFMSSGYADDGYCDEYIRDWWREEICCFCKHEYLPCKPDSDCITDFIDEDGHCEKLTPYLTCKAGDTCDDMTHYCRCEKFEKEETPC